MSQKVNLILLCLIIFSFISCKGGGNGGASNTGLSADAIKSNSKEIAEIKYQETQKISNLINSDSPEYKISDSELKEIQSLGLVSNDELNDLKTIQ